MCAGGTGELSGIRRIAQMPQFQNWAKNQTPSEAVTGPNEITAAHPSIMILHKPRFKLRAAVWADERGIAVKIPIPHFPKDQIDNTPYRRYYQQIAFYFDGVYQKHYRQYAAHEFDYGHLFVHTPQRLFIARLCLAVFRFFHIEYIGKICGISPLPAAMPEYGCTANAPFGTAVLRTDRKTCICRLLSDFPLKKIKICRLPNFILPVIRHEFCRWPAAHLPIANF